MGFPLLSSFGGGEEVKCTWSLVGPGTFQITLTITHSEHFSWALTWY